MNILSAQQMKQAEQKLLKVVLRPQYRLNTPLQSQYEQMNKYQSPIFPKVSSSSQETVKKMVTLTDNLRGIKLKDPNAVFHGFLGSILSILYHDTYRINKESQIQSGHFLLETIKCSLYSPDIDFNCIKGVDFLVETLQMKAMTAHFLTFIENQSLKMSVNRLKCAQWFCEHNPVLIRTFTLFFRFILTRLEVDGSGNYNQITNPEESIVNLTQFFDLSYRNFGQLFLFYEEGLFIALTESEVVLGDYFQNENEKKNEQQQIQMKSSVKLNMIQSFLLNINEKNSMIQQKGTAVVESDIKRLHLLLDSSTLDEDTGMVTRQKETDSETPHFHQSQDIYHFGKKKEGQVRTSDIKLELNKLISDQSDSYIESEHQSDQAPTPFLGNQHFSIESRFQQTNNQQRFKSIHSQEQIDSPIDELNTVSGVNLQVPHSDNNYVFTPGLREMNQNVNPFQNIQTPKSPGYNVQFNQNNDSEYYMQEFQGIINNSNANPALDLLNCPCREVRISRCGFSKKTVSYTFAPQSKYNHAPSQEQNQKKLALERKYSTDVALPSDISPLNNSTTVQRGFPKAPNDHKPAFLKTLKKNKQANEMTKQFTKSTVGNLSKKSQDTYTKKDESPKIFQKTSAILMNNSPKTTFNTNRSIKDEATRSHKVIPKVDFQGMNLDNGKYSPRNIQVQASQTLQNVQNVRLKVPENADIYRTGPKFLSTQNSPANKNGQPYKFYAPVQIIAPTVYLNNQKNNNSNLVFKVNDYNERSRFNNPEVKTSKTSQESQPPISTKYNFNNGSKTNGQKKPY